MRVLVWQPRRGTALFSLGVCLALSVLAVLPEPVGGPLRVAVPGALQPAAGALVAGFTATHPEAQVHLFGVTGEAAATALLRSGRADVALLRGALAGGRPAVPGGLSQGGSRRLAFSQVGWEAVALAASPFAPPTNFTLAQVAGLLAGDRLSWPAVAPGSVGQVEVLWTKDDSVLDLLREVARAQGRELRLPPPLPNITALRRTLLRRPAAVGFLPVQDLSPEVRAIQVAGTVPSRDDLTQGRYPLARPLYLAYPAARARPGAAALVKEARRRLTGAENSVTLLLGGDFLAAGPVGDAIKQHGPAWPLKQVAALLGSAGLAVVNLEAPLSDHGWRIGEFLGAPGAVAALREAGVDAVTLANDHILDGDDPALLGTIALLDREGIAHAGAGATLSQARQPALLTAAGVKVALLAYGRPELGQTSTGRRQAASPWSPGIAPAEAAAVAEDVRQARAAGHVVVVIFHWGGDGEEQPRPEDRELARAAVEAGASVVCGQGPGEAQGLEVYQGGLILYNVGYLAREDQATGTRTGVVARVTLGVDGAWQLELFPVTCRDGQVVLHAGSARAAALRLLHQRTLALDPSAAPAPVPPPPALPPPASLPGQE